jgi:hypothetical protein
VLFHGPGCISKYGKYQYAKNENSNKIGKKWGMDSDGVGDGY